MNRLDLLPPTLTSEFTPQENAEFQDKVKDWLKMSWGKNLEIRIVGEVKAKLNRTLKDRVGYKIEWDTATW